MLNYHTRSTLRLRNNDDEDDDSDIEQGDTQQPTSTPKELYEEFRSRYQQTFFTVRMKEKHM